MHAWSSARAAEIDFAINNSRKRKNGVVKSEEDNQIGATKRQKVKQEVRLMAVNNAFEELDSSTVMTADEINVEIVRRSLMITT